MDNSILSMTFGRAGHGMSVFSEGAEASPGLSLEQKEKRRIEKEKTRLEDARRLEAVCEAFLKNHAAHSPTTARGHDVPEGEAVAFGRGSSGL